MSTKKLQRQCQHLDARGIYGDEINQAGGKRGYCFACGLFLDALPKQIAVLEIPAEITFDDMPDEDHLEEALLAAVSRPTQTCPDGGACHHDCASSLCYRVRWAEPLSGAYPDDEWPVEILKQHQAYVEPPPQLFTDWLASTRELQIDSYGVDPSELDGDERAEFVRWNVLAATDELHEALQEVAWKPWGTTQGALNRDAFIKEMVDCLHFCANLLATAGCTDEEFSARYREKQQVNRDRMASGTYTGIAEKCPGCHRDKQEVGCWFDDVSGNPMCKECATDWVDGL